MTGGGRDARAKSSPTPLTVGRRRRVGLVLMILLGLALRLAPMGRYVTPDEPAWAYRSIHFADALVQRDWASMPNTGHPGVTTMWLGAAGVLARRFIRPAEAQADLKWLRRLAWLAPENGEAFRHLAPFLSWGRVAVALVTVAALGALYALLGRLFSWRTAFLTTALLLFDPFLVGHSGLLHTDALLATFSLLAVAVALQGAEREREVVWWPVAGLFTGLAVLTKTPGVLLILVVPAVLAAGYVRSSERNSRPVPGQLALLVVRALLFGAAFVLVVAALYPPLWSQPATILGTLRSFGGDHIRTVQRPIFFAGQMRYDPGLVFYPTVLLFRMSPLALVGLVVGAIEWARLKREHRFSILALLTFSVLFGVGLSLGAKKHDRYLLPALISLNLAAALGVSAWSTGLGRQWRNRLTASVVFLQVVLAAAYASRPLAYANPLLGGTPVANRTMALSWGEDTGAAARYLNQLRDASELTVATDSVPSFASLFVGRTIPLGSSDRALALADYVIGSSAEEQLVDLEALAAFGRPVQGRTVIYTNTLPLRQAAYLSERTGDNDLILLDADTPLQRRYRGAAALVSAAAWADEATVAEKLEEAVLSYDTIWLIASEGASAVTVDMVQRQLAAVAEPQDAVDLSTSTITRYTPRLSSPLQTPAPHISVFGGELTLVEASVPDNTAWVQSLAVTVRWRAAASPGVDYWAVLALRDQGGHTWARTEGLVKNGVYFPTSAWDAGSWCDQVFNLDLPPGIPPAQYSVEASLYDRATQARVGAVGSDGSFRGTRVPVGYLEVDRPHKPSNAASFDAENVLQARLGPLTLLGFQGVPEAVLSGDRVSLSLFWEADAPPRMDYDLYLKLADLEGAEELEIRQPLSPYPTSLWQAGDRFQTVHRLHVSPTLPAGVYGLAVRLQAAEDAADASDQIELGKVEVLPRQRSFSLPDDISNRVDLRFGDSIHLRGYHLERMEAEPGGELPLTLHWQADANADPTDRSYTLFVHLLGPDGVVQGQVDRVPGGGAWQTSSWAPGQVIVDRIDLPVPAEAPPGEYTMAVGFYDPQYGGRLSVTTGAQEEEPATWAVLPVQVTVSREVE